MTSSSTRKTVAATCICLLSLSAGCALDPVDRRPEKPFDNAVAEDAPPEAARVKNDWWRDYGDPGLDKAVELALAGSPDLDSAMAQVRESRAAAGLADSGFWPTLSANGSVTRQRYSENTPNPAPGRTINTFGVGAGLSYEIDLWGRVRNRSDAAMAEYRSAHADLASARLLVAAEVVRAWFELAEAVTDRDLFRATLESWDKSQESLTARHDAGLVADDVFESGRVAVENARADLESAESRVSMLRHALALAIGKVPDSAIPLPADTFAFRVPVIPRAIPSSVLKARPDIVAADLRLDAALAREGAARANFYPNITLSASGGFSSIGAHDLFASGSRVWSLGPTLSLPLFTGGKNDAELEASRARFDTTWSLYKKVVLTAFRETEDAQVVVERSFRGERSAVEARRAAGHNKTIAEARFASGLVSVAELQSLERAYLQAVATNGKWRIERLLASANLARAAGGGWDREGDLQKSVDDYESARSAVRE